MKKIIPVFLLMLLTACAVPQTFKLTAPFDETQARALMQPGKNTVTGSALIKRNDGVAVTCAGAQVALVPATAYAIQRFKIVYGNDQRGYSQINRLAGAKFEPDVPEYVTFAKINNCNAQGFFTFRDVADGDFFVITTVVWNAGSVRQGGELMQRVRVSGGQTAEIVLAP